jgi:hypothetical protein
MHAHTPREDEDMHFNRTQLASAIAAASLIIPATALAVTTINGGPGNNHLRGTVGNDIINGNGGNDRIHALAGDDQVNGGRGNDRAFGNAGNDVIAGVQGNDWLNGGAGDDTISGDANNTGDRTSFDRIFGASGNDTLRGGDSMDRMYGGTGNDKSYGESGHDRMSGGTGDDLQDGGAGNDTIFANRGNDISVGGDGNDVLWALARADVSGPNDIIGDSLDGGNGDDVLRTRDGETDQITCGAGNDKALLDNADVITDATTENPNGSCETVQRKAPKASDTKSEDAQEKVAAERVAD